MLISHRKQFIFAKTIKTAGTSVESYFEKYCMPEGAWQESHYRDEFFSDAGIIGYRGPEAKEATWYNHMSAKKISELVGPTIWNNYYKFTVIRNPFDKLISAFYFNLARQVIETNEGDSVIDQFRNWIINGGAVIDRNKYLIDGEECMDFYIRFESLYRGIKHVCKHLSIPFSPSDIPEFKKGKRSQEFSIKEFFDEETKQIVQEKYAWELEKFGYHLPT